MERTAWFCPSCQRHHAPHVETCPKPVDAIGTLRMPVFGPCPVQHYGYDPCANCKGACGNAACPKRAVVTSVSGAEATGIGRPQ